MPAVARLAGLRSGRLVAVSDAGSNAQRRLWLCRCDCGGEVKVPTSNITRGLTKSCGCLGREVAAARRGRPAPNAGKTYAIHGGEHVYSSRQNWALAVIRERGNRCEVCGWGEARCDVHHKIPGLNTISNGRVLCPNHHRIEHERHA